MSFWKQSFYHLASSTSFICWLAIRTCSAQTNESSLGEVRFQQVPAQYDYSTLVQSHSAHPMLLLWSRQNCHIALALYDSSITSVSYTFKITDFVFDEVAVDENPSSKIAQWYFLNRHTKTVYIVKDFLGDTLHAAMFIHLPFPASHLLVCDINNDHRPDVLVYDRNTPGILPFISTAKGGYIQGPLIAPDNPISAVASADMNNDNLVDLIIYDWVKSEMHMFYGVGKGRFLDQSTFPVQGEIDQIIPANLFRHPTLDLALISHKTSQIQVWEGSDFGDFHWKKNIHVENHLVDVAVGDLNHDGLNDFLVSTHPGSVRVFYNADEEAFTDLDVLSGGEEPTSVHILSKTKDRQGTCIVLDKKERTLIVRSSHPGVLVADTAYLSAGLFPTAVIAYKDSKDSVENFAVTNTGSGSISMYFGSNNCGIFGPVSYSVPAGPRYIAPYYTSDSTTSFIVSYPQVKQISYVTINRTNRSLSNTSMLSEGASQIVSMASQQGKAECVTLNTAIDAGCSLSFYEQISGSAFIEQTFRLAAPNYLLGAVVADVNHDPYSDIIFAYRAGDTSAVTIAIANGDSNKTFRQRYIVHEFSMPDIKSVDMWYQKFEYDTLPEIILYAGNPVHALYTLRGDTDGTFSAPQLIASGILLEDHSELLCSDVDGDGKLDILVGSSLMGGLVWLKGLGNGTFEGQQLLLKEPRMSHFTVGDFNGDGITDVVLTLPNQGVVKVVNGKLLFPN